MVEITIGPVWLLSLYLLYLNMRSVNKTERLRDAERALEVYKLQRSEIIALERTIEYLQLTPDEKQAIRDRANKQAQTVFKYK